MNERLKVLLSPLNFAAYIAWAAIGWELLFARWSPPPGGLAWPASATLLALMHVGFLALFLAVTGGPREPEVRMLPRLMLLGQVALAFALMLVARNSSLPILLILCVIQVVHLWSPRPALAIILAINVAMYLVYRDAWQLQSPLISTVMHGSFQCFAALTAWFAFSAERTRDELAAANADLLATRSLLAETARDSERLRLSRELHDVAGHKLTALKLNLAALARDPRFAADGQVQLCARLADELLADIRGVVQQMRQGDGLDLEEALTALARPFPRPRLQLEVGANARVASVAQAEAVLRAVQEGLTNAVKHSQAQNLWVVLRREDESLRLDIRDDGRGSGEVRAGNGLCGMRERLEALGGGLSVGRTGTGGVHLQAWLPVAA
ncbi:sensor histidine kinase [Arenimonas sp.]|uniref:sensor histidine kinase n=1 Tax=Arenimonas sp. TaxID=1872635 RepID=UPI002E334582|nr:histidine kinase [Arenimonas sp.]HEX4854304.1 histidine kinase [Arenimonas sp.]